MNKKTICLFLLIPLLFSCSSNKSNVDPKDEEKEDEPIQESEPGEKYEDEELKQSKTKAINELKNFVNLSNYREFEQKIVLNYIQIGTNAIELASTVEQVNYFLKMYEGYISKVKTDSELSIEERKKNLTTDQIQKYAKKGYEPVFKDSNFQKGFTVTKTTQIPGQSFYHDGIVNPFNSDAKPDWQLAQWNSNYDFLGDGPNDGYELSRSDDGLTNTYTCKGKMIDGIWLPSKKFSINSYSGEIYLEENGRAEYEHARRSNEQWPCLLFEQGFDTSKTKVSDCSSIVIDVDYKVEKCVNYTGSEYNYNNHAAQLLLYLTIQNLTGGYSNPDYGKYIWFGIMLYDDRYENKESTIYRAHDAGTNTLIYNLPTTEYLKLNNGKTPKVGQRVNAVIDIVPYLKEAMEYSKQNGYLGNTKYEDLYLGGTNFGYEIPGTFDIQSTIYSINVFKK